MDGTRLALRVGRSIAAIVVGYVLFVLGAWVAQEAILGGVSFHDPIEVLLAAGLLTPVSAVIGGFVTAALAGVRPFFHIVPMCLLITAETTFLYLTGKVDGPLWFEAGAGASLVVGAIVGCWLWRQIRKAPARAFTRA